MYFSFIEVKFGAFSNLQCYFLQFSVLQRYFQVCPLYLYTLYRSCFCYISLIIEYFKLLVSFLLHVFIAYSYFGSLLPCVFGYFGLCYSLIGGAGGGGVGCVVRPFSRDDLYLLFQVRGVGRGGAWRGEEHCQIE